MNQNGNGWFCKLGLASCLTIAGSVISTEDRALTQITTDGTLGAESSIVTPNIIINGLPSNKIDGGAHRGENLFHSFQEFNVGELQGAYFTSPDGVENILSRVTGGSRSNILGTLGVLGNANLFLINPNGIIFGQKAGLDIRGSFIASTASSLNFADSTQFIAAAFQTTPLLTVSVPVGLQFGAIAESISNQSRAIDISGSGENVGLKVDPGKTLALVGGEVVLEGGYLTAEAGWVELGSVAASSLVTLIPKEQGLILGYEGTKNFQDIKLSEQAVINPSGVGSNIDLHGRNVMITNGSQINTVTLGAEPAGNLTVTASDSVQLTGISLQGSNSGLFSSTNAAGDAGNITINTGRLLVEDGAVISTESAGVTLSSTRQFIPATGQGGDLIVNASESIELINGSVLTATRGLGDAGDIKIATGQLIVRDRSILNVSSQGIGDTGDLKVTADSIFLDNQGNLIADTASGSGGDIKLRVGRLQLRHNSNITTNARDNATGGNITINTDTLVGLEDSNITATAEGEGGFIQITAQGIFGLEVSEQDRENSSDITAFSEKDPSLNGEVEITRPEIDPSSGLVTLPTELVDVSGLIAQGCSVGGGNTARGASKFVATGRGGLPPTPTEALRSDSALADLGTSVQSQDRASAASTNPTNSQPTPLVEAQGWVIGSKGEVVLVAQAPTVTPHTPWLKPTTCNGS